MLDFAKHIIGMARISNQYITNLHLQNIMYFTFVDSLRMGIATKEQVATVYLDEYTFVSYPYGIKECSVYNEYSNYGSCSILEEGLLNNERFGLFNSVINDLLETEVFSLINESKQHPFYLNKKNERCTLEDIVEASKIEIDK